MEFVDLNNDLDDEFFVVYYFFVGVMVKIEVNCFLDDEVINVEVVSLVVCDIDCSFVKKE